MQNKFVMPVGLESVQQGLNDGCNFVVAAKS